MKLLTFYKLNDEEKNALKEESPLEKEMKLLSQQNGDLELQLKILKGKKRTAEDKVEKLEKENESLRCDISRYDVNNSALHSRIDKMKSEIENLKSENEFLQSEIGKLKSENESLTYNISQCDTNNSALHSRIDKMKNEIENLKSENEFLKSGTKRNNVKMQNVSEKRISFKVGNIVKLGDYNWTVIEIEQKRILLLCNESVITSIFQSSIPFSTANWKNSTIRKWLNVEFFNTFSHSEKEKMIVTEHENIKDKIFLLDKNEFIRTRKNIFNINKEWWLRPSGTGFIEYYSVDNSMNIRIDSEKSDEKAVRPAFYIKNNF